MSLNKFMGIGQLGKDPELRTTANGTEACSFSIAISEKYKDSNGEKKETTTWINVVAFKRLAQICGEYLVKGSNVFVEGKISSRSYDGKDGEKKYVTEVIMEQMQMLGSKLNNNQTRQSDPQHADDSKRKENSGVPF